MTFPKKKIAIPLLLIGGAVAVESALLGLAHWQWQRYQQRLAEAAAAQARPAVVLEVAYAAQPAFAWENQPHPQGQETVGWRWLAVARTSSSVVVIDRGWSPPAWQGPNQPALGAHAVPSGTVRVAGVWAPWPTRRGWLGGPDTTTHPHLLAFLNPHVITAAPSPQRLVLTQPDTSPSTLVVAPPPSPNPYRHLSYSGQWLAMALAFPLLCGAAWRRRKKP